MKSKEEIEQLAERYADGYSTEEAHASYIAFQDGYTQCQQAMIELLKEEIKSAFIHGQGNAQMMEAGLERDEVDDYTNSRMLSLNKND
jgi:hypothetical protein